MGGVFADIESDVAATRTIEHHDSAWRETFGSKIGAPCRPGLRADAYGGWLDVGLQYRPANKEAAPGHAVGRVGDAETLAAKFLRHGENSWIVGWAWRFAQTDFRFGHLEPRGIT